MFLDALLNISLADSPPHPLNKTTVDRISAKTKTKLNNFLWDFIIYPPVIVSLTINLQLLLYMEHIKSQYSEDFMKWA